MQTPSTLSDLNAPQREAVVMRQGAVMVLAGAGSGKTRVLTRRLAHLLQEGEVSPGEILAVTFTNKAAREMRERVVELLSLDPSQAHRLWIGTFHGMGARILRSHADQLDYRSDFGILAMDEQLQVIKKLTSRLKWDNPYWTPKRLSSSISRWKDDGLKPEDLTTDHVKHHQSEVNMVADFFSQYQTELRTINAMDFGDLLSNCLVLFQKNPEILDYYRYRFVHVLVDEYQDTNKVQYDWMKQLASGHGNLCVVGDDDQSIYSWRGARLDNILRFEDDFPSAQIIRLEQNYRSSGTILRAASALIHNNSGRMGKTLWTEDSDGSLLQRYTAEDGADEARFVAAEIHRLCSDGNFERAAILVRTAQQTRPLEEALNHLSIPYQVVGGLRFMDRAEIKDVVAYLRLTYLSRDDLAFERVFNVPSRKLGPSTLVVVQNHSHQYGLSLLDAARECVDQKLLKPAGRKNMASFVEIIDKASKLIASEPPETILKYLIEATGYDTFISKSERETEKLENIEELKNFLAQTGDLVQFLEMAALESDLPKKGDEKTHHRVIISTLHAAKGLEFPFVFLVGLEEGLLPHKLALQDNNNGLEEERRLAYVGMTRARERLYLCHARRRLFYNRFEPAIVSRFLKEIPLDSIETKKANITIRRSRFSRSRY